MQVFGKAALFLSRKSKVKSQKSGRSPKVISWKELWLIRISKFYFIVLRTIVVLEFLGEEEAKDSESDEMESNDDDDYSD